MNARELATTACTTAVPDTGDTITILRSAPNLRMAKLIRADRQIVGYDSARHFDAYEMPVSDLADVAHLLTRLAARPRCCVIRGALLNGARGRGVRRLLYPDRLTNTPATLRDVARRWLALDLDSLKRPEGIAAGNLVGCAAEAVSQLPAAFQSASCTAQASASHGIKPGIRLRLWFWLDRPTTAGELKHWLRGTPADPSIFNAAQPIYTADPVFAQGALDHLTTRLLTLRGAGAVSVPTPAELVPPPPRPPPAPLPAPSAPGSGAYAFAALRGATARLTRASEGSRHSTMISEARSLARFIDHRLLTLAEVQSALGGAAEQCGKTREEAEAVIAWALEHPSASLLPAGVR